MRFVDVLAIVWRLPLAIGSFVFFRVTRFLLASLRRAHFRNRQSLEWFSMAELLDKPLATPIVMVTGPRWNPHALIATAGPFRVQETLSFDAATADASAGLWTLVIYSAARTQTVGWVGRRMHGHQDTTLSLPAGAYSLVVRYYDWNPRPRLPAVAIDGATGIAERSYPDDGNAYLRRVQNTRRGFYVALHYYVYVLLKYRALFPAGFVRSEFVPVGNPETDFRFGSLDADETLDIRCDPRLLTSHRVFVCVYNLASFPVTWFSLDSEPHAEFTAASAGYYLIRLHPRPGAETASAEDLLSVRVSR